MGQVLFTFSTYAKGYRIKQKSFIGNVLGYLSIYYPISRELWHGLELAMLKKC